MRGLKVVGRHKTPSETVDIPIQCIRPFKVIADEDNVKGDRFSWAIKLVNLGSKCSKVVAHIKEGIGYKINVREQPGNIVEIYNNDAVVVLDSTFMTTFVVSYSPNVETNEKLVEFVIVFEHDMNVKGTKHYLGYFLGTRTGLTLMEGKYVLTVMKKK